MPQIRSQVLSPVRRARVLAGLAISLMLGLPLVAQAQFDRQGSMPAQVGDLPGQGQQQQDSDTGRVDATPPPDATGGVQVRQGSAALDPRTTLRTGETIVVLPPYVPNEFERYVEGLGLTNGGEPVRRFGASLLTDPSAGASTTDPLPTVPGSYVIKPGDEIAVTIWGAIDADLRLTVSRAGTISIPRVGAVNVGGLHFAELAPAITRQVGQQFHNFQLTASVGAVRAIRVFVNGYARRPGSIAVNGLSSLLHVLMRAGGPSAAGSFRDVRLNRGGKEIARFDLYDVLLKDDRRVDELVQPDDIVYIGPIGPQVAIVGSVNQQAIFELKPGETLNDALQMAGGFTAVADSGRVSVERLSDRHAGRVRDLALPEHAGDIVSNGDVIWAYSAVGAVLPKLKQNERIHIEGEVAMPGDYLLPPGSTSADAVRVAGGLTKAAYPFGTEFTRRSVRKTQQANYERALRDLETSMAKSSTGRVTNSEEATARASSAASNQRLLERLRELKPSGRIVLEIEPDAAALPEFPLEDGDSITVPGRDSSVGVFGSVFNAGSFAFRDNRTTDQYLHLAGGPTRGADKHSMFLIRANGSVVSAQQGSSFWHSGNEFREAIVFPGDAIFVPEELDKSTFVQDAKDWTQILYQFGLGIAGINALNIR
jgi:protein involved in polysaccharide export with SLBB domain